MLAKCKSTKFRKRIQSCHIRRLTCFSAIQNLVPVVEKKIGPEKAQQHQCLLLGILCDCSPKELSSGYVNLSYSRGSRVGHLGAQGSLQSTLNVWCKKNA